MHFGDESLEIAREKKRLINGRELSPFDDEVFGVVAALTIRLRKMRESISQNGEFITDDAGKMHENPAIGAERRASQELRGWVKDRPDLFGEKAIGGVEGKPDDQATEKKVGVFPGLKPVT